VAAAVKEFWAAMLRGDTGRLKRLIAAGIDVNQPWQLKGESPYGNSFTPLLATVSTRNVAIAKFLLDHGADVHGGNRWMTPLLWAAARRDADMVTLLQEHGATATIFVAAALGQTKRVDGHLRKNEKLIEQRDEHGQTSLHYTSQALRAEVTALLLKAGADVNAVDALGSTPLHIACDVRLADRADQRAVMQLLLGAGANVNATANHEVTPLHRAVRARNPVAVALLLKHGAKADPCDARGSTPLRRAVSNTGAGGTADSRGEAIEIIKLLLRAGADPRSKNKEGKTVLASVRDAEMKKLLRNHLNKIA